MTDGDLATSHQYNLLFVAQSFYFINCGLATDRSQRSSLPLQLEAVLYRILRKMADDANALSL